VAFSFFVSAVCAFASAPVQWQNQLLLQRVSFSAASDANMAALKCQCCGKAEF